MKLKNILTGSIALMTLATTAKADVEVRITGATAFRTAAINALKAQFDLGGSYTFAHNKTVAQGVNSADRVTFKGTFPGVAGITTVRVSHNGSVEGVRAIAQPGPTTNPFFITDAALAAPGGDPGEAANENASVGGSTVQQVAKFSYTDVRQSSTPVSSPTLSPANPKVGVTLFTMLANDGAPAGLTNVTFQQFKALFVNGSQPLSLFTGNAADTNPVYATGRNDGSGTRTAYMAESQLGITTLVSQFVATTTGGLTTSVIQKVPAGGATINGTFDSTTASTLWAQDLDGNGGYFSGSVLRDVMGRTTAGTQVLDADGSELAPAGQVHLITWITAADAVPARVAGAKVLGWNGSTLDSLNTGTTVNATDLAKITEGQYSAWTFQNLYFNGSLSGDENTVYTAIKNGIPASLVAAGYVPGVPSTIMNVSRPDDGAPIAP